MSIRTTIGLIMGTMILAFVCVVLIDSATPTAQKANFTPQIQNASSPGSSGQSGAIHTNEIAEQAKQSAPSVPAEGTSSPAYTYNAQGQLTLIQYSNGSTYSYMYDQHGDKISETLKSITEIKTWTYRYDANQKLVDILDPQGRHAPIPSQ